MQLLKDMWAGLDTKGRTVLIACVTVILLAAIATGFDLLPWLMAIGG